MSDLNKKTPGNPNNDFHTNPITNIDYELLSSYIDDEIQNEIEKDRIKKLIDSDTNYYNRYVFEKLTKENFKKRLIRIETPVYVYKNIGNGIDDYIKKSSLSKTNLPVDEKIFSQHLSNQKSTLKRNLIYSSFAFLLLIAAAFLFNSILKKSPEISGNDLGSVSRNVFDKVESGQVKLKYQLNNASALSDSMNKNLDFKVFIPDVKDATLLGGVCNEINGQKVAHIVHKKGDVLLYTLQANLKDVLHNDKIVLSDKFRENIIQGKNWFPCLIENNRSTVIWVKDNVICSTVAAMDYKDIAVVLTNFK